MRWPADSASQGAAPGPLAARRLVDVAAALLGLCLLSPVLLLVSLAILVEGGRPILFSQLRIGRDGRPFRMYKFRKFHERAAPGGLALTLDGDPRMTRVGRLLQATKLDELPQLWNMLKGDMTIVGPRPESPDYADCYADAFAGLLAYQPGIFGPNQIIFRNESSIFSDIDDLDAFYRHVMFPLKASIDAEYFARRNAASDLHCFGACLLVISGFSSSRFVDRLHAAPARLH